MNEDHDLALEGTGLGAGPEPALDPPGMQLRGQRFSFVPPAFISEYRGGRAQDRGGSSLGNSLGDQQRTRKTGR